VVGAHGDAPAKLLLDKSNTLRCDLRFDAFALPIQLDGKIDLDWLFDSSGHSIML
jgi:hypothetical protein